MHGLEDLAGEVEEWSESRLDSTVTNRFNPCFNLAQFLMRNNPLFLDNGEKYKDNHILERELKRRVIQDNGAKLKQAFKKKLGAETFPVDQIPDVFIEIDELMDGKGNLKKAYVSSLSNFRLDSLAPSRQERSLRPTTLINCCLTYRSSTSKKSQSKKNR